MHLTILGAGTCLPVANHSAAGYLVRVNETPLLIDAGPGTIARLAQAGVSYRDLEYVFITHLHPDHTLDLVTLLQALVATPGWKRTRTLYFAGCPGFASFLDELVKVYKGIEPRGYSLEVTELDRERRENPGWTIETAPTGHAPNSRAFRIQANGRTLVYSGDAVENASLAELARDADLFVCECSLPEGTPTKDHLTAGGAGRLAHKANVKRLVLTHLYPPALAADVVAQAAAEFKGPVLQAVDGLELEI